MICPRCLLVIAHPQEHPNLEACVKAQLIAISSVKVAVQTARRAQIKCAAKGHAGSVRGIPCLRCFAFDRAAVQAIEKLLGRL